MEKEKPMLKSNGHKMMVQSFLISKPEQVHHFQMRVPRNAKQIVAIDYDVFVKSIFSKNTIANATVVGHLNETQTEILNQNTNPKEIIAEVVPISDVTKAPSHINFNWTSRNNQSIGKLKLQSLETANIFYSQWIKLLEWNNGVGYNGIFPNNAFTLLQKQAPRLVNVSPQTTILSGLYEDAFLGKTNSMTSYKVNVCVWLEMNEEANGIDYEFLKSKAND